MTRVKRGVTSHARHKKIIKQAKGFYGRRKNVFKVAIQAVEKSLQYSYRDRRNSKRTMRSLWIQRINAGVREYGITYSRFIAGLKILNIDLNRKMISHLAYQGDPMFAKIVSEVKKVV